MWSWTAPERTRTNISEDDRSVLASAVFDHNDTAFPGNPSLYPDNMLYGNMTEEQYDSMLLSLQDHRPISIDDLSSQLDDGRRRLIHVSEFSPHELEKNQTCSPIMTAVSAYTVDYPMGQHNQLKYFVPPKY